MLHPGCSLLHVNRTTWKQTYFIRHFDRPLTGFRLLNQSKSRLTDGGLYPSSDVIATIKTRYPGNRRSKVNMRQMRIMYMFMICHHIESRKYTKAMYLAHSTTESLFRFDQIFAKRNEEMVILLKFFFWWKLSYGIGRGYFILYIY